MGSSATTGHDVNRVAWDAGHRYLAHKRAQDPSWSEYLRAGGHCCTETEIELFGDLTGIDVLQLSCAGDAAQAFSFANLGARVWACDFSAVAIREAREHATEFGIHVEFSVDDSTKLSTYEDDSFDFVHVDGNLGYYQDLEEACRNWSRVLRQHGRLALHETHFLTSCFELLDDGRYRLTRPYHDLSPEHYQFGISDFVAEGDLPAIDFRHTMAEVVNAIASSGLRIERMVECTAEQTGWGRPEEAQHLPPDFYIIARK